MVPPPLFIWQLACPIPPFRPFLHWSVLRGSATAVRTLRVMYHSSVTGFPAAQDRMKGVGYETRYATIGDEMTRHGENLGIPRDIDSENPPLGASLLI